jgi:hypothetical protein
MGWRKNVAAGLLAAMMLVVLVAGGLGIAFGFSWVADYVLDFFTPYWERHKSVHDPKLQVLRCIDRDTGEMMEIDPPCLVLTLKGRRAIEEQTAFCRQKGGAEEACRDEAWAWMRSKQRKP